MNKKEIDHIGKFTLVANFYPVKGKEEELQEIMDFSMEYSVGSEGLIQAFSFRPEKSSKPFIFISIWESKKHWQNFMKSPEAKAAHQKDNLKKLFETALKDTTAEMYSVRGEWHMDH